MWIGTRPDEIFFHPLTCREHLYTMHVAEPADGGACALGSRRGKIFENPVVQKSGGQVAQSVGREAAQRSDSSGFEI